jgi:hypothetical protein
MRVEIHERKIKEIKNKMSKIKLMKILSRFITLSIKHSPFCKYFFNQQLIELLSQYAVALFSPYDETQNNKCFFYLTINFSTH